MVKFFDLYIRFFRDFLLFFVCHHGRSIRMIFLFSLICNDSSFLRTRQSHEKTVLLATCRLVFKFFVSRFKKNKKLASDLEEHLQKYKFVNFHSCGSRIRSSIYFFSKIFCKKKFFLILFIKVRFFSNFVAQLFVKVFSTSQQSVFFDQLSK